MYPGARHAHPTIPPCLHMLSAVQNHDAGGAAQWVGLVFNDSIVRDVAGATAGLNATAILPPGTSLPSNASLPRNLDSATAAALLAAYLPQGAAAGSILAASRRCTSPVQCL